MRGGPRRVAVAFDPASLLRPLLREVAVDDTRTGDHSAATTVRAPRLRGSHDERPGSRRGSRLRHEGRCAKARMRRVPAVHRPGSQSTRHLGQSDSRRPTSSTHADQLRERLEHYFRVASKVIEERGQRSIRPRPLVALPIFADRGGGGGPVRGDTLRVLYGEAKRAAESYRFGGFAAPTRFGWLAPLAPPHRLVSHRASERGRADNGRGCTRTSPGGRPHTRPKATSMSSSS